MGGGECHVTKRKADPENFLLLPSPRTKVGRISPHPSSSVTEFYSNLFSKRYSILFHALEIKQAPHPKKSFHLVWRFVTFSLRLTN